MPSNDISVVRSLTADTDPTAYLLTDEQIDAYLTLEGGNVWRAAATALDTIAVSEVLVGKKIRTQDLATDGPAVSAELRSQAAQYRARAAADDAASSVGLVVGVVPLWGERTRPEGTEHATIWGL